jgi:hypothetical protein
MRTEKPKEMRTQAVLFGCLTHVIASIVKVKHDTRDNVDRKQNNENSADAKRVDADYTYNNSTFPQFIKSLSQVRKVNNDSLPVWTQADKFFVILNCFPNCH